MNPWVYGVLLVTGLIGSLWLLVWSGNRIPKGSVKMWQEYLFGIFMIVFAIYILVNTWHEFQGLSAPRVFGIITTVAFTFGIGVYLIRAGYLARPIQNIHRR